jgi:hypothetical protein
MFVSALLSDRLVIRLIDVLDEDSSLKLVALSALAEIIQAGDRQGISRLLPPAMAGFGAFSRSPVGRNE